jgi:hypothetical protein
MTAEGPLSIGERFRNLEKRMNQVEERIIELRLESTRQQLKLAIAVGLANLVAFGIVELVVTWMSRK